MKMLLTMFLAVMFLVGTLMIGNVQAITWETGGNKILFEGKSYINQENDKLWGITYIDTIKNWNPDTETTDTYWTAGDGGEYLSIKYGGLDISSDQPNSSNTYFENGWAQLWSTDKDAYQNDEDTGPGSDYEKNDFGQEMAQGDLLLDMLFADDVFSNTNHTFEVEGTDDENNRTYAFLDVVGGLDKNLFDTDYFRSNSDIEFEGSNSEIGNAVDGDWNFVSDSYSSYAMVPEPGTLLLLGTGLLGLAGFSRRMRKHKSA